jgi:uncharacterized membrane protein
MAFRVRRRTVTGVCTPSSSFQPVTVYNICVGALDVHFTCALEFYREKLPSVGKEKVHFSFKHCSCSANI